MLAYPAAEIQPIRREAKRVFVERTRIMGGGVTVGIDMALTMAAQLIDRQTAESIQLGIGYDPAPPFNSGLPETAQPKVLDAMKARMAPSQARRIGVPSGPPRG